MVSLPRNSTDLHFYRFLHREQRPQLQLNIAYLVAVNILVQ